MFWVLLVHLAIAGPQGKVIDVAGSFGPPIAYANRQDCEDVAQRVQAKTKHVAECRFFAVLGMHGV